jgi:hypothetical protein
VVSFLRLGEAMTLGMTCRTLLARELPARSVVALSLPRRHVPPFLRPPLASRPMKALVRLALVGPEDEDENVECLMSLMHAMPTRFPRLLHLDMTDSVRLGPPPEAGCGLACAPEGLM